MITFALVSLGNVHEFFANAGHPAFLAWTLAVALGASLVVLSIMLTHVDRTTDKDAWTLIVIAGLSIAIISGALQSSMYSRHLDGLWPYVLGYAIPVIGEIVLAFAVSAYEKSRERAAYRNVGQLVESAVATHLEHAVQSFNSDSIERHVQNTINSLAKQAVTHVSNNAMEYYTCAVDTSAEHVTPNHVTVNTEDIAPIVLTHSEDLTRATSERTPKERKKDTLLQLLNGVTLPEEINKTALGEQLNVTRQTTDRYMKELVSEGRLSLNGTVQVL